VAKKGARKKFSTTANASGTSSGSKSGLPSQKNASTASSTSQKQPETALKTSKSVVEFQRDALSLLAKGMTMTEAKGQILENRVTPYKTFFVEFRKRNAHRFRHEMKQIGIAVPIIDVTWPTETYAMLTIREKDMETVKSRFTASKVRVLDVDNVIAGDAGILVPDFDKVSAGPEAVVKTAAETLVKTLTSSADECKTRWKGARSRYCELHMRRLAETVSKTVLPAQQAEPKPRKVFYTTPQPKFGVPGDLDIYAMVVDAVRGKETVVQDVGATAMEGVTSNLI
jgi:hypothetical protein